MYAAKITLILMKENKKNRQNEQISTRAFRGSKEKEKNTRFISSQIVSHSQ